MAICVECGDDSEGVNVVGACSECARGPRCMVCDVVIHGGRPICGTCDREGREAAAKGDWRPVYPAWREA